MRITYDRHPDTLSVVLKEGVAVGESDEGKPGVILDYDAVGDLVSLVRGDAVQQPPAVPAAVVTGELITRTGRSPRAVSSEKTKGTRKISLGVSGARRSGRATAERRSWTADRSFSDDQAVPRP